MRVRFRARWGAAAAALTVIAVPLLLAQGASAAPVPPGDFTCGNTVPLTPCNQTAHFDTPSGSSAPEVATPSPQATGCPAWVAVDFVLIQGTGNGIEHAIVNNALDGWFTSTFAGTVTAVAGTFDSMGNFVPDASVPPFTGHLQQWFGGSFNRSNSVQHDTINFTGTAADGTTFGIHLVDHFSTSAVVAAAPNSFSIGHC